MDDPLHYANIQLMVLATDLRKVQLESTNDIEQTIGKLQTTMHQLFQVKQQVESMETQAYAPL
jgi:hypothetical protein